jgi:hypothetical protein
MTIKSPKLRANQRILNAIKFALQHAELGEYCAVEPEHQEAMRLYLQSWVVGPLKSAIEDMKGTRRSQWNPR